MHRSHRARRRIGEQDGHAIGHADENRMSSAHARDRVGRDARGGCVACGDNRAPVHLAHVDDGSIAREARGQREARVVLADVPVGIARLALGDARIRLHALEIERVERRGAHATEPRREGVAEPSARKEIAREDDRASGGVRFTQHGVFIGASRLRRRVDGCVWRMSVGTLVRSLFDGSIPLHARGVA